MPSKAHLIDHTLLAPTATRDQVLSLCEEAKEAHFASVCVNPYWVPTAHEALQGSGLAVCTVIGFPLGATTTATKEAETRESVAHGANEIDMVMNLGLAKAGEWEGVQDDIRAVVEAADGALVKVILETCLLDNGEIVEACRRSVAAGAHFVKTSTGFSTSGATEGAVRLMRETVGPDFGVKASGGIRTAEDFTRMVEAGANRIGASAGLRIIKEGN
ncbi:deoxyribose-phosphate aldolase [Cutibacterium avidum]|uniref:deoxyribose-phosphate aldolase n=1 Tax=Cutibacterium avidum TaxID=33010 RepID=UPI0008F586B0|nr:deoxyribose-phosphate aldolase [Cutibacterium avidum]MCO6631444.1 deoxyribose-phosphate aldolase [Cutibacterium avidum]MCO6660029.1 deoxyribose-phosphate aldolase [Cutibacterium avidum]MCO6664695.1 deoxyribose-phosphate aldolase [Cutibacterium avidum]MCT1416328.1 deoxyribose-phosphate aldolase [Cutibacterium avidum]MCX8466520.1 deoxyribose-phosphate aldolase [Cutibacterium avidum]